MPDTKSLFDAAAQEVQSLAKKPDSDTLLKLYALYKQSTVGDATGKRPGFTDFVGRAKFDAWAELAGTPQEQAMQAYVDLVNKLKAVA